MQFRFIRLLDQLIGKILLWTVGPLCLLIARFMPARAKPEPETIAVLKLHGGGSLLIAAPALMGIRTRYPNATIVLVGTADTKKYAELSGVFDRCIAIDSSSPLSLVRSSLQALRDCFRFDVFIDLEPHSFLAGVFCPLTFAARRLGMVKAREFYRARSYTEAIYFNPHAPIHPFYAQLAGLLDAEPADIDICRAAARAGCDNSAALLTDATPRPVLYLSAFASRLSAERMLPASLWIERLKASFGAAPFTLILGGGQQEAGYATILETELRGALPGAAVINACGKRTLRQSAADIDAADEFWGIDSGPLHIARLLGKKCTSFWGPTNPSYLLAPIEGLNEQVHYAAYPCSPCVHVSVTPPCKGDNRCMKLLFEPGPPVPFVRL